MTVSPSSDSTPPLSPPTPPAWARACDLLCLGLVILAVIVVRFGGFHLHAAGAVAHRPADDVKLARGWADAYLKSKGPQSALVKEWMQALEKK